MFEYMWAIWLGVFVISVIIEATTTELVSIFFAFGSVVTLIISFIPGVSWWIQLIIFVAISGASLIGLRPLMHKFLNKEKRQTNVDELIGKKISIIDENNDGYYEAKINGIIWRVININEEEKLKLEDKVEIVSINGNKLVVRKVK